MNKQYYVAVKYAYKDDEKQYGQELTIEDLDKKNYNKTYECSYYVDAPNKQMAIVRAMEDAGKKGWFPGNYLYVIDIIVNLIN